MSTVNIDEVAKRLGVSEETLDKIKKIGAIPPKFTLPKVINGVVPDPVDIEFVSEPQEPTDEALENIKAKRPDLADIPMFFVEVIVNNDGVVRRMVIPKSLAMSLSGQGYKTIKGLRGKIIPAQGPETTVDGKVAGKDSTVYSFQPVVKTTRNKTLDDYVEEEF